MDRDDEFRRNAAQAQQRARQARTDDERATWLHLAEGWLGLRRRPQTVEEEAFNVSSAALKPGQVDSESLH
jgi:hypothetical protein